MPDGRDERRLMRLPGRGERRAVPGRGRRVAHVAPAGCLTPMLTA